MLGGIDPIIIFEISKLTTDQMDTLKKTIPKTDTVALDALKIKYPPIPIYLSEKLTGLSIVSEDKNIDLETTYETLVNGQPPVVNQKAVNSTVRVNIAAVRDSIGLTLLTACADLILPLVTSREYAITYLHAGVTVFRGLLHSFAVNSTGDSELMSVTIELTKATMKPEKIKAPPTPERLTDATTLSGSAITNNPTAAVTGGGATLTPPTPAASVSSPSYSQPAVGMGLR